MKGKTSWYLWFTSLLFVSSTSYAATVDSTGAEVFVSTQLTCPSFCTDSRSSEDGGRGETFADATNSTFGFSRGQVDLANPDSVYLPLLRAESRASNGGGARARIFGAQGFTYDGLTETSITLDLTLDIFLDGIDGGTSEASALTTVGVFLTELDVLFYNDYPTVKLEAAPPGSQIGESEIEASLQEHGDGDKVFNDTLTINLMPGDQFVVWAGLELVTKRGGVADAFETFSMSFSENTGLIATSIPDISEVPLPAGVWLFLTGIGAVFGFSRFKQAKSD